MISKVGYVVFDPRDSGVADPYPYLAFNTGPHWVQTIEEAHLFDTADEARMYAFLPLQVIEVEVTYVT